MQIHVHTYVYRTVYLLGCVCLLSVCCWQFEFCPMLVGPSQGMKCKLVAVTNWTDST